MVDRMKDKYIECPLCGGNFIEGSLVYRGSEQICKYCNEEIDLGLRRPGQTNLDQEEENE